MSLSSCGTQTVESNSDRLMIENTIIIQQDPMVQDSWDSARKITCDWQSKLEKMVTFAPFPVADLQGVAEIKFAGSGDNVKTRMEIQFGRGPFAAPLEGLTKIGDELSVVVYVQDGGAGYDILVKNCYAYDSKNFKNANKIRLLNEHGCLYRPHQMEYFKRTFDVRSTGADIIAFARMNAFKFPDKMDVYLSCELEMCKGGCDTHCEMDDYPIDIIETLRDEPRSRQLEVEAVPPATTFRPADSFKNSRQSFVKRRRRLPKKFGANKVDDDAAKLLTPPATLSPEILELLEEISLDQEDISERSFKGNSNSLDSLGSSSSTQTQHVTAAIKLGSSQDDQEGISHSSTTEKISKMSFSTLFSGNGDTRGGTHITSNEIPSQIMNNPAKFKPSELLSATIERNSGPFTDQITSLSKGSTGSLTSPRPRSMFPPRLPVAAALQSEPASAPINAKLTNIMVHDITNPLFARSDKNAGDLLQSDLISNSVSQPEPRSMNLNNNVNTLQQQLVAEGQSSPPSQAQSTFCQLGSTDPKCNPASYQINVGGFLPISTTPNANSVVSSTVIFTSPRSVEKLQQHLLSGDWNQPKEVLLRILDSSQQSSQPALKLPELPPKNPPFQAAGPRREGRKKFGSRLTANTNRFAHFFGARKRREASDNYDNIRNVFAESETVNMVKGFQVVSAADLAFNPNTLTQLMEDTNRRSSGSEEICFNETSFYAGLLVACSLLLISGMVSVCSIRKIRKYQQSSGIKKMFFGDTCSTLERYH